MEDQFHQKLVEPNSGLGDAFNYEREHGLSGKTQLPWSSSMRE
jgi:hypothetical protein